MTDLTTTQPTGQPTRKVWAAFLAAIAVSIIEQLLSAACESGGAFACGLEIPPDLKTEITVGIVVMAGYYAKEWKP